MLRRIEEIDPIKACKLRIERYKLLLAEEEAKLEELENLERMTKLESKKQKKKTVDPKVEAIRLSKFNKLKPNLAKQVRNGDTDWKRVAEAFIFDSATEAREWIISHLQEECLID